MKTGSKGPDLLRENVGVLKSRMGTFFPGSHVIFRGHDLHTELKDMDWVELYTFGITGRRFSPKELRLLHSIWTYTSYPDVRLWNNRVAALAGSARSTGNLGVAAALAVSEASIYGRGIDIRAIEFLLRTRKQLDEGCSLEECVRRELESNRSIAGYGRPLINGDERNQHLLALKKELGFGEGVYLRLAFEIEEFLFAGRWRMKMNYAGLVAALAADLGFSPREYYLFLFPAFLAGMQPCLIEASERPEGALYPISCSDILYEGRSKRPWRNTGSSSRE
ncbi:citryl-CoA lyase [Herbaspirillum sp. ST 5-3]|uniref:citryl-CoA lyase n=1 Tax=Oxalobacteraceae TaxID=75682 RepID=UPI0010A53998|nr:citryl-CoA lyase [Herbaspirillum sp. ST 5-3]